MLKILLPLVIEKPFIRYLRFDFFFFCSRKTEMLLLGRNNPNIKIFRLAKDISKPLDICIITQSKCHWWYKQEFVTECNYNIYYMERRQAINKQIFVVPEVSGRNRNPNSGTETFTW